MSTPAATSDLRRWAAALPEPGGLARALGTLWWLWLLTGIAWIIAAVVILQFNTASVKTVGIIVGVMFIFAGLEQLALAMVADSPKWVWTLFGILFLICGVVALVDPADTFRGLADVLGFLFLTVGIWWTIQAFLTRDINPLWWLTLLSGILMIVLAFWTSGQLLIDKVYTLLVFAGAWALMHGV